MTGKGHRYVALLRGVNVGGNAIFKMLELRELFESYGLQDVTSYIQSGNIVFTTPEGDPSGIARDLENKLNKSTGREIKVFVLDRGQLLDASEHNPFFPACRDEDLRCHLMFLSGEPDRAQAEALAAMQGEEYRFHVRGRVLYYAYPGRYAGHRRSIDFERVLGVQGTSRTWKVVAKLIELLA
jgi:uncharacterized protein (DUF1697 family)